jgi:AcrR family transcriptional regulator
MSAEETRIALMDAAVRLTATQGTRGLTVRSIATEAGVNQALVHYHFKGVEPLLREAYERATVAMLAEHASDLETVRTFEELYRVGAALSERARLDGSASLLSHVVAAAHTDPVMADLLQSSLDLWRTAVAASVARILQARGLTDVVEVEALSGSLAAATIGMLTLGGVPGQPLGDPISAVEGLPRLLDRTLKFVPAALARRIFAPRRQEA